MKDGLCGHHFPEDNAVITAVRKWVVSAGTDFYKRSTRALVHHWRKCMASGGDYVQRWCFVADNLLYPTVLLCILYLL
jgi:hypothetical protein